MYIYLAIDLAGEAPEVVGRANLFGIHEPVVHELLQYLLHRLDNNACVGGGR
jgi:hypothetical protein